MSKSEITYESAYRELTEIVAQLESKEVDIDQLTTLVTRAKELVKFCQDKLRDVDEQLQNE